MAEELLDVAYICTAFEQVGGEAVTKCVRMNIFFDACLACCVFYNELDGSFVVFVAAL